MVSRLQLTDLPNISIALGEELRRVGIASPLQLDATGTEEAWLRLRRAGLRNCIQTLFMLEGAIQRRPWRELASDRRAELVRFSAGDVESLAA